MSAVAISNRCDARIRVSFEPQVVIMQEPCFHQNKMSFGRPICGIVKRVLISCLIWKRFFIKNCDLDSLWKGVFIEGYKFLWVKVIDTDWQEVYFQPPECRYVLYFYVRKPPPVPDVTVHFSYWWLVTLTIKIPAGILYFVVFNACINSQI